jgi:hypothetical protein
VFRFSHCGRVLCGITWRVRPFRGTHPGAAQRIAWSHSGARLPLFEPLPPAVPCSLFCFLVRAMRTDAEAAILERRKRLRAGDFDFGVAAGLCALDSNDLFHMPPQDGPLRRAQHDKGDFSSSQVLLITDALVSGQQHFKASALRFRRQLSVGQPIPAELLASLT